MESIYLELKVM